MDHDALPDEPTDLELESAELADPSDLEFTDMPGNDAGGGDADESAWEAFLLDDDWEPRPAPDDFWIGDHLLDSLILCLAAAALGGGLV